MRHAPSGPVIVMLNYDHERKPKREYSGPPAVQPPPSTSATVRRKAIQYLNDRGLDPTVAGGNGWYPTEWDVPRIVVPCTNSRGEVYFQARRIDSSNDLRYRSPANPAKDSIVLCWPKDSVTAPAVIVEGPLDALAAACCGFVGVGLMGNQPPPERLAYVVRLLGKIHEPFLVVPDLDNQEFGASLAAAFSMQGVESRVVMPRAKDLCEMPPKDRQALLLEAIGKAPRTKAVKKRRKANGRRNKKAH